MDLQGFTTIDEVGDDDDITKEVSINITTPKVFPSTAAEEIDCLNRLLDDIEKNSDCNNKITSNGISQCKDKTELLIQSGVKLVLNKVNSLGLKTVTNFYNNNMDKVDIVACVDNNGKIDDSSLTVNGSKNTSIGQIESTSDSEKLSLVHDGLISDGNLVNYKDKDADFIQTNIQICSVSGNKSDLIDDSICRSLRTCELNTESEICDEVNAISDFSQSSKDATLQANSSNDSNSIDGSCENLLTNQIPYNESEEDQQFLQNSTIDHSINYNDDKISSTVHLEAERTCMNIVSSQEVETASEELSDLSRNNISIDESDDNYINISLPLKIIQVKAEPQEMEEEFDFGDFLHDPAEEFNLDSVKEEHEGESTVMETFSIDTENVETKPEPCDNDDIEQECKRSCYVPYIHYLVKENEKYSKEQVTAALLMSQSSSAKVIDMEMFTHLGQTFPITSLYKLEYLVDDLQILPFRDNDLVDNFFQMYGSNPRKWAKFFKFKRKYTKWKDDNTVSEVIEKVISAFTNTNELEIQNKKVETQINIPLKVEEKNVESFSIPIYSKQLPNWSESDKHYIEESRKRVEAVFERTVKSGVMQSDSEGFNGFVKVSESHTQLISEKIMSELKYLQLELDKKKVACSTPYNDDNSEEEIMGETEITSSNKQASPHKKVKDKHKSKYKYDNRDTHHLKMSDREKWENSSSDKPKHRKENNRDFSKMCEDSSGPKEVEAKLDKKRSSKHVHNSKSSVKSSKAILDISMPSYFEKKYLKYDKKLVKKYKLKKCDVNISTDTKLDILLNKIRNPMPESKRCSLIKNYMHFLGKVKYTVPNCKALKLLGTSYDTEDSLTSDALETPGDWLHEKSLKTYMPKKDYSVDSSSNLALWKEISDAKGNLCSGHQMVSSQSSGSDPLESMNSLDCHSLDSMDPANSQEDIADTSFANAGLFSDTSSISINEELCDQLKEIDNILSIATSMPKSHSPSKRDISIQHKVPNLSCDFPIEKCKVSNTVSSDTKNIAVNDKNFKDKYGARSSLQEDITETENSRTLSMVSDKSFKDKNDTKSSPQEDLTEKENTCSFSLHNTCSNEKPSLSSNQECDFVKGTKKEKVSKNDSSEDIEKVPKSDSEIYSKNCSLDLFKERKISKETDNGKSNLITKNKLTTIHLSSSGEEKKFIKGCHVSLDDIGKDILYKKKIRREKKRLIKQMKFPLSKNNDDRPKVGPLSSKPVVVKKDAFEDILTKAMDKTKTENLTRKKLIVNKEKEPLPSKDQVSALENKKTKQKHYLDDVRLKIFREGFAYKPANTDSVANYKMDSNSIPEELPIFGAAFRIPKKVKTNNDQEKKEPLSLLQRKEEKSTSYYDKDMTYSQHRYGRGLQDVTKRDYRATNAQESVLGGSDLNKTYVNSETSKPFAEKILNVNRSNNISLQKQFSPNSESKRNIEQIMGNDSVNRTVRTVPSFVTAYASNQYSAKTQALNVNTDTSTLGDKESKIPVIIKSSGSSKYESSHLPSKLSISQSWQNGPCTPDYDRPPSVYNDQYDDGMDMHSCDSLINSPIETNADTSSKPDKMVDKTLKRPDSPQLEEIRKVLTSVKNCLKLNNSPKPKEIIAEILPISYSPDIEDAVEVSVKSRLILSYSPDPEVSCKASENHSLKTLPDLHLQTIRNDIRSPNIKLLNNEKENKSAIATPENRPSLDREAQQKAGLIKKLDSLDRKGQFRLYEKYKSLYNSAKRDYCEDTTDINRNLAKQKKYKALQHYRKLYYDLKIYLCEQKKSSHEKKVIELPVVKESNEQIQMVAPNKIISPIEKVISSPLDIAAIDPIEKESFSPKDSDPYSPSGSPVLVKRTKTSVSDISDSYHVLNPCKQQIVNDELSKDKPSSEESESTIKDIISSFFTDHDMKKGDGKNIHTSAFGLQEKPNDITKTLSKEQVLSCGGNGDVNAPYSPTGSPVNAKRILNTGVDSKDAFVEYLNIKKKKNLDGESICSKLESINKLPSDIKSNIICANKIETLNINVNETTLVNLKKCSQGEGNSLYTEKNICLDGKNINLTLNKEEDNNKCQNDFRKHIVDAYEAFSEEIDSIKTVYKGAMAEVASPVYSPPGSPLIVENVCGSFLSHVPPETKEALIATKLELAKECNNMCRVKEKYSDNLSCTSESSIEDVVMDDAEVVVEESSPRRNALVNNCDDLGTQVVQNIIDPMEVKCRLIRNDYTAEYFEGQPPVSLSSSYSHTSALSSHEPTFNSSFNSLPLLSVPTLPNVNIPPPQYLPNYGAPTSCKPSGILGVVVEDLELSGIKATQKSDDQHNVDFNIDISLASSLLLTPPPPPLYTPPASKSPSKTMEEDTDPSNTCLPDSNVAAKNGKKSAFNDLISEFFQTWEEPPMQSDKQHSDFEIVYSKVQEKSAKPSQDAWVFYSEPPLVQGLIDKVEKIPLVGLQYILEVQKEPTATAETCSYICSLCSKKMSTATLLAHVKSVPHRLKYTECHSKEIHQKYGKLEVKQWTAILVKEFTTTLENLEKNTGRQSMAIVKESKMNSGVLFLKNKVQTSLQDIEERPSESGKGSSRSLTNGNKGSSSSVRAKPSSAVVDITKSPRDRFKRPGESPRMRPRSSDTSDKGKDKESPRTPSSNRYSRDRDGKLKDGDRPRDNDRSRDSVRSRDGNRSRDRDRHGDSLRKDRRYSSDRSTASSRKKSRSPLRRGNRSQERSSNAADERRIKDFRVEESRLKAQHDRELERYTSDPESHPRYKAEWGKFWERRSREIEQQGRDPRYYDFKMDWIPYWKTRMAELCNLEFQAQRKEYLIRYRIEDPDKNKKSFTSYAQTNSSNKSTIKSDAWVDPSLQYNKPNSGQSDKNETIQKQQQSLSSWGRTSTSDKLYKSPTSNVRKPSYEVEFSVVGTLKLLTDLEDQLGSLVPVAKALLKKAIDITENGGRPLELFGDNDNLVLLRLSKVKLTSQVTSGILDAMAAARTQMAIESINWLLKEAEKYYASSNYESLSHMLGLDLILIAKATFGMDTVQVAMYIAQQLLDIGKSSASETELQQILSAVSSHHMQLKSGNEALKHTVNQQIRDPQAKLQDSHLSYPNYSQQNYPNKGFSHPAQSGNNMVVKYFNQPSFQNVSGASTSVPALFPAGAPLGAKKVEADVGKGSASETASSKTGLSMLQAAYEDNSCTDMDKLSLNDLQELLSNFRSLNSEKQQALTDYLKKLEATDSKKVTKLRAMMHHSNKPPQPTPKPEVEEKIAVSYPKDQLRFPSSHNNNEPLLPMKASSEYMSQSYNSPPTESKEYGAPPRGNLLYGGQREPASDYFQSSGPYDYKLLPGKGNEYSSFSSNNPPRDTPNEKVYPRPESSWNYSSMPGPAHYQDFIQKPDNAATSSFRELSSNSKQFSDSSFPFNKEMAANSFSKPSAPPTDLYPPRNFGRPDSSSYISESFRNFDAGLSLDRPTSSFRSDYNPGFQQGPESSYDSRNFMGESHQNFENNSQQQRLSTQPNQTNRFPSSNFPERGGMHPTHARFRGPRFRH